MKIRHVILITILAILAWVGTRGGEQGEKPKKEEEPVSLESLRQEDGSYDVKELVEAGRIIEFRYGEGSADYVAEIEEAVRDHVPVIITKTLFRALSYEDLVYLDYGSFWVKTASTASYFDMDRIIDPEGGAYQMTLLEYCDYSDEEILRRKEEMDREADDILAQVPQGADIWQKMKTVHDELCRRVSYDQTTVGEDVHNAYGALVRRSAVCDGYASAFTFLCRKLGQSIRGVSSEDHAWNMLISAGTPYLDVTWDDTDQYDRYGRPYISYDYFFISKEDLSAVESHSIEAYAVTDSEIAVIDSAYGMMNYFAHEGCLFDVFDPSAVTEACRRQYADGSNYLTVRFSNEAAYRQALSMDTNGIMQALGCYEPYYLFTNDELHILSLGLYAPEDG